MKHIYAPILAATLAFAASTAYAGGPIVIEEEMEIVPEKAGSSIGILPIIIVTVALCAALCGSSDEDEPEEEIIINPPT